MGEERKSVSLQCSSLCFSTGSQAFLSTGSPIISQTIAPPSHIHHWYWCVSVLSISLSFSGVRSTGRSWPIKYFRYLFIGQSRLFFLFFSFFFVMYCPRNNHEKQCYCHFKTFFCHWLYWYISSNSARLTITITMDWLYKWVIIKNHSLNWLTTLNESDLCF